MSVIKQISVFNGSDWNTGDIGADASNIDISSSILGSSTNVQSALTTIGNKIGTTAIPFRLGTTITGAINTLNTTLNTYKVKTIQITERTQTLTTTASLAGFAGATWTSLGGVKVPPNIPTGCVFVGNLGIIVNGSVGIFAIFDGINQHHNLEVNPYIYNSTKTTLPVGRTLNLHMYSLVATTT